MAVNTCAWAIYSVAQEREIEVALLMKADNQKQRCTELSLVLFSLCHMVEIVNVHEQPHL